jgi:hypothetical protein
MSTEEEIRRQIDNSENVNINEEGEIIPASDVQQDASGRTRDRVTGEDTTRLKPNRWYFSQWYDSNPGRLLAEKKAMSVRFPSFELRKINNGLAWSGTVKPKGPNAKTYQIVIQYPSDYPYKPPQAFVIRPHVKSLKHKYSDDSLCLMYPGDNTYTDKTTAVQAVAMVATWLWCYEDHAKRCPRGINCTKDPCPYWPGPEAPH